MNPDVAPHVISDHNQSATSQSYTANILAIYKATRYSLLTLAAFGGPTIKHETGISNDLSILLRLCVRPRHFSCLSMQREIPRYEL